MQSETFLDKPELIERYPDLIRINYGITKMQFVYGEDNYGTPAMTPMYVYQMKEYAPKDFPKDADTLANELMLDRYPLEEQVLVLSSEDADEILKMNVFKQTCKDAARQIFNIPETLKSAKEKKEIEIDVYDQSENVNSFIIQGVSMWLDRNTRAALMRRFEAEKATNITQTTLWYEDLALKMPVDNAIKILNEIEIYACKCYDVTAGHKAAVEALTTIADVNSYDYKTGYPNKISY